MSKKEFSSLSRVHASLLLKVSRNDVSLMKSGLTLEDADSIRLSGSAATLVDHRE